jgi:hypothetical protein
MAWRKDYIPYIGLVLVGFFILVIVGYRLYTGYQLRKWDFDGNYFVLDEDA